MPANCPQLLIDLALLAILIAPQFVVLGAYRWLESRYFPEEQPPLYWEEP
jgi:hypothetical protein